MPQVSSPSSQANLRARARLLAVILLALLAALYIVLGLRLYFAPPVEAVLSSILAVVAGVAALAYGLSARWVAIQRRWGHLVAIVVAAVGVVFGITGGMTWLEWAIVGVNLAALVCLAGSIPRKIAPSSTKQG